MLKQTDGFSIKLLLPLGVGVIGVLSMTFILTPTLNKLDTAMESAIEREVKSEMETTITEEPTTDTENPVVKYLVSRDYQNKIVDRIERADRSLTLLLTAFVLMFIYMAFNYQRGMY